MFESICLTSTPMLANYSSLWEVFTAFFSSMLLSDILGGIWTPEYKSSVTGLIKNMGIPFVKTLEDKLESQIEENVKEISGHMHRRAIFMIFFCVCLLGLTGAESNLGYNQTNIAEIIFWLVIAGVVIVLLGAYTFSKNAVTLCFCLAYGAFFFSLCHWGHQFTLTWNLLSEEKYVIWLLLVFMCIPKIWQMGTCWIYSSLFYGKLREELHKEEIQYKMAIIGIKTRNVDLVPEKYKVRAAIDISKVSDKEEDISYESCDGILYTSVDALLDRPIAIKILISWIRHRFYLILGKKTIDDSQYINEQFRQFSQQVEIPVSELSHTKNASASILDRLTALGKEDATPRDITRNKLLLKIISILIAMGITAGVTRKLTKK